MRRLTAALLALPLVAGSLWGQTKVGGTTKIGGTAKLTVGASVASVAYGSVAFSCGSDACAPTTPGVATQTWSHTIEPNAKVACIGAYAASTSRNVANASVGASSASIVGTALTTTLGAIGTTTEMWCVNNPPTGSQTITVTWNAGSVNEGGISITFTDGNAATGNQTNNTTNSVTVTSASTDMALDVFAVDSDTECTNLAVSGSNTKRGKICDAGGTGIGISTLGGQASAVLSWTTGGGLQAQHNGVNVH